LLKKRENKKYIIISPLHYNSLKFRKLNSEENTIVQADISVIFDTGTNLMILPYYLIYSIGEKLKKYNCIIGSSSSDGFGEESSFIICLDIFNIPDISLQFGDYVLILNKYKMYFIVDLGLGILGYRLNIYFQNNLNVAIIGQIFS
jgi:hypothetical protein